MEQAIGISKLFSGIPEDELESLLVCLDCRIVGFSRGDIIAYSGQMQKYVGILLEGKLSLAKENPQGQRMLISVLSPGDSFGEVNAFSGSRIWPVTISADNKGNLLTVPLERIGASCEKRCFGHWALIMNLLKLVSEKALILNRALDYLGIKGIRRKLAIMLIEEADKSGSTSFKFRVNRAQMADFFYVARPALSRELGILRDAGAISFSGSNFRILDMQQLKQIVENDV